MEHNSERQERRKEQRAPAYMGGQITTDRRLIAIDCVVRNMSGAGAKLVVPNATVLPDEFELHVPRRESAYRVRARWRHLRELGVEVMPLAAANTPVPLSLARRIRRLETENASLRRRLSGCD
jgi:hypothetical protein